MSLLVVKLKKCKLPKCICFGNSSKIVRGLEKGYVLYNISFNSFVRFPGIPKNNGC